MRRRKERVEHRVHRWHRCRYLIVTRILIGLPSLNGIALCTAEVRSKTGRVRMSDGCEHRARRVRQRVRREKSCGGKSEGRVIGRRAKGWRDVRVGNPRSTRRFLFQGYSRRKTIGNNVVRVSEFSVPVPSRDKWYFALGRHHFEDEISHKRQNRVSYENLRSSQTDTLKRLT